MVLSVGDLEECAAKKGRRHLLSLPKLVSVPDRRNGVGWGGRTGDSALTNWPRANVIPHPSQRLQVGFKEVTHA